MRLYRKERINDLLRDEISRTIMIDIKDPVLNSVTITAVKVSSDLGSAVVYFSKGVDNKDIQVIQDGLSRSAGFIRFIIKKNLCMRRIPVLKFKYDDSIEYGMRIEGLLAGLTRNEK
ncbi:MAG TPA: 30S ribosome-binding factor RbfA [bacterium]